MTKIEYQNTIKTNLTIAEALCADLRKLRNFKKLAATLPTVEGLLNADVLDKAITDREAELKKVRGELGKARRIVKHLEEIEAIESGAAAKPKTAKKPAVPKSTPQPVAKAKAKTGTAKASAKAEAAASTAA